MAISRYSCKNAVSSIYCYPGTNILKNKLHIKDGILLEETESDYSGQRLSELMSNPINGKFSLTHLLNIHKYIFQDIYYFAGKLREEDISKGETKFCRSQYIKSNVLCLLSQLKDENFLTSASKETFSSRISFYMAELNIIHPFREGNGRAIREFARYIALRCNYSLNWAFIDSKILLQAFISSVTNITDLTNCISYIIKPLK